MYFTLSGKEHGYCGRDVKRNVAQYRTQAAADNLQYSSGRCQAAFLGEIPAVLHLPDVQPGKRQYIPKDGLQAVE
jgi:hypothetical protein